MSSIDICEFAIWHCFNYLPLWWFFLLFACSIGVDCLATNPTAYFIFRLLPIVSWIHFYWITICLIKFSISKLRYEAYCQQCDMQSNIKCALMCSVSWLLLLLRKHHIFVAGTTLIETPHLQQGCKLMIGIDRIPKQKVVK